MTLDADDEVTTMDLKSTITTSSVSVLMLFCAFIWKTMSFDKPEFLDSNLWAKYKPLPVEIKTGSVYDYYDVYEEIGM